ncbi:unnamed protein product [Paramecium sonneborni]|uniref:Uncharacterized protein n=1 Tax=Paramecium sonneborni TaxID=65129 RepID=A0A8S1R6H5_9CILI|nr:unnamed protein product [Paramecium sonneborni]
MQFDIQVLTVRNSSFVEQYSDHQFIEDMNRASIEVEFVKKLVIVDKHRVVFQIWDNLQVFK